MKRIALQSLLITAALAFAAPLAAGQTASCKLSALNALRKMPKIRYKCLPPDADGDDLGDPARLRSIDRYLGSLRSAAMAGWWSVSADDLNSCAVRRRTGPLAAAEKQRLEDERFIFGDAAKRFINIPDPCYQTSDERGFIGILLVREKRATYATKLMDDVFTRHGGMSAEFATDGSDVLIGISATYGAFPPITIDQTFFSIDRSNGRSEPKNLFLDENGAPTNRITSVMNMDAADDAREEPLRIIVDGVLAKSFFIWAGSGGSDELTKRTLTRDGKLYR